jgi:hypothetical protein
LLGVGESPLERVRFVRLHALANDRPVDLICFHQTTLPGPCSCQQHEEARRVNQIIGALEAIRGGVVVAVLERDNSLVAEASRRGAVCGRRLLLLRPGTLGQTRGDRE